jgi:hypothetical protein
MGAERLEGHAGWADLPSSGEAPSAVIAGQRGRQCLCVKSAPCRELGGVRRHGWFHLLGGQDIASSCPITGEPFDDSV